MPNVTLISLDTMRHDALRGVSDPACWQRRGLGSALRTPNLDRFARECHAFRRCYSTSAFTPPGHASMMTGRFVPAHGAKAFFHSLRPGVPTLASRLREEGHVSIAWYENECLDYCGILRDFDEAYTYRDHSWGEFAQRLADLQCAFPGKVFAFVHLFDLHSPYLVSLRTIGCDAEIEAYFRRLDAVLREMGYRVPIGLMRAVARRMERPPTKPGEWTHYAERVCANGELLAEWLTGRRGEQEFRARAYAHGVSFFDQHLWPVVERDLRAAGLMDADSVTLVTADHGEAPSFIFDKQRFAHKADMVEGCLRVPLLVRCPGPAPDTDQLASLVDLAPTVLALLGLPSGDGETDGTNLWGSPDPARVVFAEGEHFEQTHWDKWAFRRGQEEGRTCLKERAVISRDLKLVRRGDLALLEGLAEQPPARQVDTIYRAVIGRLVRPQEHRTLLRLLETGQATALELAEVAQESICEQGLAERLIATTDVEEQHNLIADPRYAAQRDRLAALLDAHAADARSQEATSAGYADGDEAEVMRRLGELGYV